MLVDLLIKNVNLASMTDNRQPYGSILNTCIAVSGGKIVAIDEQREAHTVVDAAGGWLTPGLIDCHTHLLFGGDRADEFDQRLQGASYAEISRRGGGIASSVKATREMSVEDLVAAGKVRLQNLLMEGVTSVEIKSGYGLDLDTEANLLRAATQLQQQLPQHISRTYLGAHALPREFNDNDAYIDYIVEQVMPALASKGLIDAVDVFCEGIGFSTSQCKRVFEAAQQLTLPIKAHAEQLSDLKGARLAAEYGALSVDHVEYLQPEDVPALKASGTVAVVLPGAFYFLREQQLPPIDALRAHQVPIAVATDFNPGSSPIGSLLTVMNMACVLFRLTPEEVLRGVTVNAAQALGLSNKGKLAIGHDADLLLWEVDTPAQIMASIGLIKPTQVWIGGTACR